MHFTVTMFQGKTNDIYVLFSKCFIVISEAQLQSLADDEGALLEMINKLPQLNKIVADRQELCEKNEQLASMLYNCTSL